MNDELSEILNGIDDELSRVLEEIRDEDLSEILERISEWSP